MVAALRKRIAFPVCFDQGYFTFFARFEVAMFHTHDTTVAFVVNVFEDVFVIHFAGGRLFSAGIVSNLEVNNLIPAFFNVWNNVSLVSLHVVHVEQNFARRTVYRPADSIGLIRTS